MTRPDTSSSVAARWVWLAAFLPLALHGALYAAGLTVANQGRLFDPDAYMRLVRVAELAASGDWYSERVARTNAPYGSTLPWSRPLDALLLASAWAGTLITDFRTALFWAAALSGPLLQVAAVALVVALGRRLAGPGAALLAAILFLAQSGLYSFFQLGRGDHHALQITLLLAVVATLAEGFDRPSRRCWPVAAGSIAALALWVSAEALLVVLVAVTALGLLWLRDGGARALAGFCAAFALGTTLALIAERPLAGWLTVDYDKVSVVHVVLALAMAATTRAVAAWRPLVARTATLRGRALTGASSAALVALVMALGFPGFFVGPFGNLTPEIDALLMADVSELRPLWPTDWLATARLLFFLGPVVVALPSAVWHGRRRDAYLLLALGMVIYLPLALRHMRVAPFVEALMVVPWAAAVAAVLAPLRGPAPRVPEAATRIAAAIVLVGWHVVASALVAAPHREALPVVNDPCPWDALAAALEARRPAADRPIVLSHVYPGSELLWRTGYDVVSAPYHDDRDGIVDTLTVLAARDDAAALAVIDRRGVGVIVLCRVMPYADAGAWAPISAAPDTLYRRLLAGTPPAWLAPVSLPVPIAETFVVYEWVGGD
ncbi:MAG: STT3 domain-containing protein [Alphaproteobacteria bacterium]